MQLVYDGADKVSPCSVCIGAHYKNHTVNRGKKILNANQNFVEAFIIGLIMSPQMKVSQVKIASIDLMLS